MTMPKAARHRHAHRVQTARLLIRSAVHSDAEAIYKILSVPANNPHTTVEPGLSTPEFERRIVKWVDETARGKSAFMVITLLPPRQCDARPHGNTHDAQAVGRNDENGKVIGFGGFNTFEKEPSASNPTRMILSGDTGIVIDHEHWRHGYGAEAMSGILDYGFKELSCDVVTAGTGMDNMPWRHMMNVGLGLASCETREMYPCGPNSVEDSWVWRIDGESWGAAKVEKDRAKGGRA